MLPRPAFVAPFSALEAGAAHIFPNPQPPMRLVLATRNPGKVAELAARLADLEVELTTAAETGALEVDEDADTLRGNAEKKARALFQHTGLPSLADDTGLEVDALDGAPGVHSARFAGLDGDADANRHKLLADLEGASSRTARFRTVLAFADASGVQFFDGVCQGVITREESGDAGFGYDSIFRPTDGDGRTFAEMTGGEKNAISHRGRALDAFVSWLRERG
ncbi:MAG: RdgB/HAM1 family non-canonical purine NTP pyrophosphatase [Rubrivirga sp.]